MGYVIKPKYKPIKKSGAQLWFGYTPHHHKVFMPEIRAQEYVLKSEKPIFKKLKKYELDEL